ncbi:MAG: carbonic anhydrase [Lachnospiraceae bacterium]|nr:carbonic anhydrase [Lachnospiraceae bacterium]
MNADFYKVHADEAIQRLNEGNARFVAQECQNIDTSIGRLKAFAEKGQRPYAIVVACADSRVIPEVIFDAQIGDLFVIRVAGNVIDNHQLGSIEYAAEHLGTGLVCVLGHTHCGAIDAVLQGHSGEYIQYIARRIEQAIGTEKDPYKACCLNVLDACDQIEHSLQIQKDEQEYGLRVIGAVYDLETGRVDVLSRQPYREVAD